MEIFNEGSAFVAAGVLGSAVLVAFAWSLTRNAVTAVHEAGHAVVAMLLGGKLSAIRVNRDTSGETVWFSDGSRLRGALCATAGYPAPLAFGCAVLGSLVQGWERWAIAGTAALVLLSLPLWRGLWTILIAVACVGVLVAGAWLSAEAAQAVAGLAAGVGLLGGTRVVVETVTNDTRRGDGSDVAKVAQGLFLPIAVSKIGLLGAAMFWLYLAWRLASAYVSGI